MYVCPFLQEQLKLSVPRTHLDAVVSGLQAQIDKLESSLEVGVNAL